MGNITNRKENCVWLKKEYCKIPDDVPCDDDCSLKHLKFDKDAIIGQMKDEEKEINKLKTDGMFKNKKVIMDKIAGIFILQKILGTEFQHLETHVVDKDFEKTASIMNKSFGRFKKKK